MSWEDMQTIFREISELYSPVPSSSEDSVCDINFIKSSISSLETSSSHQRSYLDSSIGRAETELSAANVRLEREASASLDLSLSELSARESKLSARKDAASLAVSKLTSSIERLTREKESVSGLVLDLERKRGQEIPRLKHAISLYANITGIKWQYGGKDGVLAGTISLPNREEVHQFAIDPEVTPMFNATNMLWDIMDGGGGHGNNNCSEVC